MRVCHVITEPELGGAQLSTLNILSRLKKDTFAVSIITSPKGILKPEYEGLKDVESFFSPFLKRPINPILDILAFMHIYSIYRRHKYNIVHTHSSKAGIIGRWAALLYNLTECRLKVKGVRCEVVHTVHGWSFNDYQAPVLKSLFIFLEKITARFTTKIICVSNKDIETGLRYKIASREKFVLIKYGIPLAEFRKSAVNKLQKRRELNITNNDPIVGMISCLKPQKSPLDYIKVCIKVYEKMPNVNFLLVGDGILRARCERMLSASPLNGRFIFTGWRRDISQILDILDIAVLTSKWEGMPVSIIEALAKGCPVIATNVGGTPELIKDGVSGYLIRPGSYDEMTEKILQIFKDRQSLEEMKRMASVSIDDYFHIDRMLKEIENLYRKLL